MLTTRVEGLGIKQPAPSGIRRRASTTRLAAKEQAHLVVPFQGSPSSFIDSYLDNSSLHNFPRQLRSTTNNMKFGIQTTLIIAAGIFGTAVSPRTGIPRSEDISD